MAKRTKKGDKVKTLKAIIHRIAFYKKGGKPGTTKVSIKKDVVLVAATDELGGNIWVDYKSKEGDPVLVPLAEGEWAPV